MKSKYAPGSRETRTLRIASKNLEIPNGMKFSEKLINRIILAGKGY